MRVAISIWISYADHGISFDALNSINYVSPNFNELQQVKCSYVSPADITAPRMKRLSILSANIRSMKTNFVQFSAEILNTSIDILVFCESHLWNNTEKLFTVECFNFYASHVHSGLRRPKIGKLSYWNVTNHEKYN